MALLTGGGSGAAASAPAGKAPLAECAGKSDAPGCLEQLVEAEEANLASAEAKAGDAAQSEGVVGKWSAARSKTEAFAMQLNSDGKFMLVAVKNGKETKSEGQFTFREGQLTLAAKDGGKLIGSVSALTADAFEFTPQNVAAGKLTFKRGR